MPESEHPKFQEDKPLLDASASRRTLLKAGAAVIGANLIPNLGRDTIKAADITTLNAEIPLTPEGLSIDRNGWSFSTSIDKFAPLTANGNSIILEFQGGYLNPDASFVFENGNLDINQSRRASQIPLNGTNSAVTDIYPSQDSDQITITYRELGKDGQVIREEELPVTLEYATYDPEDPEDRRRIWSESPLDQDLLKRIHERALPFDVFGDVKSPTFIVVPNERGGSPLYNTVDKYIQFPVNYFEDPELLEDALVPLDHERFHSIHTPATLTTLEAKKADSELQKVHEQLWLEKTGMETGFGFRPEEVVSHPAFKFFDESEYYPNLRKLDPRDMGNPFSDHRELFASGMNMMTKHGGEIIEKIEALHDPREKETTIKFTRNILSLAKEIAKDDEKLFATWPELAKVNDYLNSVDPQTPTSS